MLNRETDIINSKITTPIPEELNTKGIVTWHLVNFRNRSYNAILNFNGIKRLKIQSIPKFIDIPTPMKQKLRNKSMKC